MAEVSGQVGKNCYICGYVDNADFAHGLKNGKIVMLSHKEYFGHEFVPCVPQTDHLLLAAEAAQLKKERDEARLLFDGLSKEGNKIVSQQEKELSVLRAENEKLVENRDYYRHEFDLAQHESDKYKTALEDAWKENEKLKAEVNAAIVRLDAFSASDTSKEFISIVAKLKELVGK